MKNLLLMGLGALSTLPATSKEQNPNIIVFMADDMGYCDTGFTGSKDIKTPNLDALAREGVVFENGYANHPFSGPSRAALLSGRYPQRFGFETNPAYDPANPHMGISESEVLFPARLKKVGYTSGVIGKWHLGASEKHHPLNRGFDYFYGFLGGGHDYFRIDATKPVNEAYLQPLMRNKVSANFEGYLTNALSADAVKFVDQNKDKPFFLYVAYNAPHQPLQAPKEDIERYSHIEDKKRRTYAAMVDVMDRGIGEVVDALKRNGLYENTIIFFMSDNGGPQPSKANPKGGNASSNYPFSGGKGAVLEGGIHIPFIACWPKQIKAGTRFKYPVNMLDVSRTAVELAGANALSAPAMEGVNLIPFVAGAKKGSPHEAIFWRNGKVWAVVDGDNQKLARTRPNGSPELYNLPRDTGEKTDLASKQSSKRDELQAKYNAWNSKNIPCVMIGYLDYHKRRAAFYEQTTPQGIKK